MLVRVFSCCNSPGVIYRATGFRARFSRVTTGHMTTASGNGVRNAKVTAKNLATMKNSRRPPTSRSDVTIPCCFPAPIRSEWKPQGFAPQLAI